MSVDSTGRSVVVVAVTAVVSCFNSARFLESCIRGLRAQQPSIDRILVVDDHSADRTSEAARALSCDVVRHDETLGLSSTRNTGLTHADTGLVAFVDADVELCDGWLATLMAVMSEQHRVAMAGGRLIERHQDLSCDRWRARHMGQDNGPEPLMFSTSRRGRLSGFATLARREVLLALGGYDTKFGRSYEDIDLSHRLIDAGFQLAYEPSAVSLHGRTDRMRTLMGSCWSWDHWPNYEAGIYHSAWRTGFKLLDNVRRGAKLARIDLEERDRERFGISLGMIVYHSWWDVRYYLANCGWLPRQLKPKDADMGNLGRPGMAALPLADPA